MLEKIVKKMKNHKWQIVIKDKSINFKIKDIDDRIYEKYGVLLKSREIYNRGAELWIYKNTIR